MHARQVPPPFLPPLYPPHTHTSHEHLAVLPSASPDANGDKIVNCLTIVHSGTDANFMDVGSMSVSRIKSQRKKLISDFFSK
jgi:hypothetical protein